MDSILQQKKECFVCHTTRDLEMHHVLPGTWRRKLSEEYGLKVWLCHEHHTGRTGVHADPNFMLELKQYAQTVFVGKYGSELWMQRFGKNYL